MSTDEPKKTSKRETVKAAPKKSSKLVVADGKAINTKRGILEGGDEVTDADFMGGAQALEQLVNAGVVVSA